MIMIRRKLEDPRLNGFEESLKEVAPLSVIPEIMIRRRLEDLRVKWPRRIPERGTTHSPVYLTTTYPSVLLVCRRYTVTIRKEYMKISVRKYL